MEKLLVSWARVNVNTRGSARHEERAPVYILREARATARSARPKQRKLKKDTTNRGNVNASGEDRKISGHPQRAAVVREA